MRLLKQLDRVCVLSRSAGEPADEGRNIGGGPRAEDLNVARVGARLRRNMDYAVAGDDIIAQPVPARHGDADTRPPANVIHAVYHLEREVPDDAVTAMHALVCVL